MNPLARSSRLEKFDVFIITAIFLCLALVSTGGRLAIKLQRAPLGLNDALISLAALFLLLSSILLYAHLDAFYDNTQSSLRSDYNAVQIISWAATTAVKLAFLLLFRPIANTMKGFKKYYWTAITITVLSWIYMIIATTTQHPDFGHSLSSSNDNGSDLKYLALTYGGAAIDILSYIIIIYLLVLIGSDPDIVIQQKLATRAYLCLTGLMVIFSIVRNISYHSSTPLSQDAVWQMFWSFMEAAFCLAIIAITTIDPMFQSDKEVKKGEKWDPNDGYDVEHGLPARPTAALARVRDWMWWRSGTAGEQDKWVKVSIRTHSRGSSQDSLKKEQISEPKFVGGTSEWVVSDCSSSIYSTRSC